MQLANTEIDESLSLQAGDPTTVCTWAVWGWTATQSKLLSLMCSLRRKGASFLGGLLELGLAVGESHVELFCALDDVLSLESGDVLGDLTAVGSVVHEENFNVLGASDQKLTETAGKHVSGLGGLLVTDLGHLLLSSESAAHGAINTSGLSP